MTQDRQYKKVKTYRTLKVVFYCLGLPLFFVAVFLSAIKFIGNDPFTGTRAFTTDLGFFQDIEILFTSPALYGVWIAVAIWLVIAVVHIILSKTVKSRRTRMFSMMAVTLAVMMGTMFGMDAVLGAKVDALSKNAPAGVTVEDYKTQLSYYRTISSKRHSRNMTELLIEQVNLLEKVYNVGMEGAMEGIDKSGAAGNIGNKPVTYYNIIDDKGDTGVDISFKIDEKTGLPRLDYDANKGNAFEGDGVITKEIEGNQIVRLAPNGNGQLVINGNVFSHYFYVERKSTDGTALYTWYTTEMLPIGSTTKDGKAKTHVMDGIYGEGLYNESGMLSDGWVYSLENVLRILEDYYSAKEAIENGEATYYADMYASYYDEASQRRDDYYNGLIPDDDGNLVDPWLTALYNQEVQMTERFSLTRGEIDELIAKVGALLGDNSLFDYLFLNADSIIGGLGEIGNIVTGALGNTIGGLLKQLNAGMSLSSFGLAGDTLNTVVDIVKTLIDKPNLEIEDLYLTLAYKSKDCFGREQDHLYIGLVRGVGNWKYADDGSKVPVVKRDGKWFYEGADGAEFAPVDRDGKQFDENGREVVYNVGIGANPEEDILLDIDFDDTLIDEANGKYAFDFDTLSAFLNKGLNNLLAKYNINISDGIINTVLGLFLKDIDVNGETYKGLVISGISIPIIDSTGKINLDINGILSSLVQTLYSYQSSVFKPVWEFYYDPIYGDDGKVIEDDEYSIAQKNYAKYERALYMATVQGGIMGSVLLGDSLGAGTYSSSFGLQDLASVQQLLTDLSYKPVYFPLYAVRDMLAFFTGIVILFYFASFFMAQKEEDYASGKLTVKSKSAKKGEATVIAEFDAFELENADKVSDEAVNEPVKEKLAFEEETVEEKSKRKRNKKNKEEESESTEEFFADDTLEEEPAVEKKGLFGRSKKEKVEEPVEESTEELSTLDETAEEAPAVEKKSLFGRKKKEKAEEVAEEPSLEPETDNGFEEEEVKDKRNKRDKKKKHSEESELLEDFGAEDDLLEEEPVKEKKSLFGKKKQKSTFDDGEDTVLPVEDESEKEVL